jgi:purine-nucleoside/S-methyl-5'-thioadenosine phosphorylase / adenosine deaminase
VIECREDGAELLRFAALAKQPLVAHAVFTRHGGVSAAPFDTLNASSATGDDPAAVRENKRRMARILGLELVSVSPVHGADTVVVEAPEVLTPPGVHRQGVHRHAPATWREGAAREEWHAGLREIEADVMLTDVPGLALFWAYADCMPILLYDPGHHAVALVHAGWRGTAKGVAMRAVAAMRARYGARPEDLLAGIAPSIGQCCYTLTPADREQFRADPFIWEHTPFERTPRADGERTYAVDLWASNRAQLLQSGLLPQHVEAAELCTGCHTEMFYSNRVERAGTGRFGVGIGLREREAG